MAREWQNPQVVRAILVGQRPAGIPEISLRELAVGVFLFPGPVLVATRAFGNWRRPVLLLLLAGVVCGLTTGLASYPRLLRDSVEWAAWFGGLVGEFKVTATGFAWARPQQLPFTTRCKRWRVDFADETAALAPEDGQGRERRGVWITPSMVRLWWLVPAGPFAKPKPESGLVLRSHDITASLRALAQGSGQERFAGEGFAAYTRQALLLLAPVYLLFHCAWLVLLVVLYIWLFTLMAVVLRRGEISGGFAAVFAVNVLCAVPSMCVAGVYAALRLPALDFHTVFILAFFLYITMAFSSVRRMVSEG